jgi:hypothetical protein
MFLVRYSRALLGLGLAAALCVATLGASQRHAGAMAAAANTFLAGLTPEQKQQAALPFEGDERMRWNFIPNEMFPRKGLMIKSMTEPQRAQAHALLKTGLSQRGYMTVSAIMELENVLRGIETGGDPARADRAKFARDPLEYWVTVFGTPGPKGTWGWRLDGHHVSVHFTVQDGKTVASSPTFFGTNPAKVLEGPKAGLRVLAAEEDAGRALIMALDESQRATATFNAVAPNEIVTGNKPVAEPQAPTGLAATAMKPAQRELLMKLIDVYTSAMADDAAAERLAKIRQAGVDAITFSWAGETQVGQKHYYRVQGPTFLIEFDNVQNNGNHIHSVWRDFNGDFGRDLLKEHLAQYPH